MNFLKRLAAALLIVVTSVGCGEGHARAAEVKPGEGAKAGRHFVIEVVDEATGRGVPLVELRTPHQISFYTDSNGLVALDEPGFVGRKVFFSVTSHGYEFPADGFGQRGQALHVTAGGRAQLKIKRLNIAERLYRTTGEGVYRDSVLAGRPVPVKEPLLNGEVTGQDSVQTAIYRGRIYWLWGDTNRLRYPLGQFWMSGATSQLPGKGGLDPDVGVDLTYFVDKEGFSRGMVEPAQGPLKWMDGLMVLPDEKGVERLLGLSTRLKRLDEIIDRTLVTLDDKAELFKPLRTIAPGEPLYPRGHPLRVTDGGVEYFYFNDPLPSLRVRADYASVLDPAAYEAYTCLPSGGRFEGATTKLDREEGGKLKWGWKRDADVLDLKREQTLLDAGRLKEPELRNRLIDVETKDRVRVHGGSVYFNEYPKRWVMIFAELFGKTSGLGEIWYAEADAPEGPWAYARKILTHDRYSFYNPKHHPFFDKDGGRFIYFEGTYTYTFSREGEPTPRYDYNQIMYRLDLADPRLRMPPQPAT